jgi:hypothetical protein
VVSKRTTSSNASKRISVLMTILKLKAGASQDSAEQDLGLDAALGVAAIAESGAAESLIRALELTALGFTHTSTAGADSSVSLVCTAYMGCAL